MKLDLDPLVKTNRKGENEMKSQKRKYRAVCGLLIVLCVTLLWSSASAFGFAPGASSCNCGNAYAALDAKCQTDFGYPLDPASFQCPVTYQGVVYADGLCNGQFFDIVTCP